MARAEQTARTARAQLAEKMLERRRAREGVSAVGVTGKLPSGVAPGSPPPVLRSRKQRGFSGLTGPSGVRSVAMGLSERTGESRRKCARQKNTQCSPFRVHICLVFASLLLSPSPRALAVALTTAARRALVTSFVSAHAPALAARPVPVTPAVTTSATPLVVGKPRFAAVRLSDSTAVAVTAHGPPSRKLPAPARQR